MKLPDSLLAPRAIQTDFFPMMHRNRRHPALNCRENDRHSTAVIVPVHPRLAKTRVLIRVFGYPTDDRAARDSALDRSRIPLQASISLYKTPEISRNLHP